MIGTASLSSRDWNRLTKNWNLKTYLVYPGSNELVEKLSVTYIYCPFRLRSFDEVMEEVLEDRAEAWERLGEIG